MEWRSWAQRCVMQLEERAGLRCCRAGGEGRALLGEPQGSVEGVEGGQELPDPASGHAKEF